MPTRTTHLVGRDNELRRLREITAELRQGRGGVAWIEGEPGIGKSALIAALLDSAQADDIRVFRAEGDELSSRVGLRPLAQALLAGEGDPDRADIAAVLAGRKSGLDAVLAATERMIALVERECSQRPVMLVVDDLQWADDETLAAMHGLLRVADQAQLLIVVAARPVPSRDALVRLRTAVLRRSAATVLGSLTATDVAQLVEGRVGARPGPTLAEGLAAAAGNPLFVIELIDALQSQGSLRVLGGIVDLVPGAEAYPASLTAAIRRRTGFLSHDARAVLRMAAVLDSRFTVAELIPMSAVPAPTLTRIVDEAIVAGVLVESGRELAFRHPLIRQMLHDELSEPSRIALHEHAARVLADAGASCERIARHLLAAPEVFGSWTIDWLLRIPRSAQLAQAAIAAELLIRARQVLDHDDVRRSVVTARLAGALYLQGRFDDLLDLGVPALYGLTNPQSAAEFAWYLARGHQQVPGRAREGRELIDEFLAHTDPGPPWRGRLLAQRAVLVSNAGEHAEARRCVAEALAAGEHGGDTITVGLALTAALQFSSPDEAMRIVERGLALHLSDEPESIDMRLLFLANRLVALLNLHRWAEYERALGPTLAEAERVGSRRIVQVQLTAVNYYYDRGDWEQSLMYASQIDLDTPVLALSVRGIAALIHAHSGDRERAEEQLAAVPAFPTVPQQLSDLIQGKGSIMARALLAEAAGDLAAAVSTLSIWLDPRVESNAHASIQRGASLTLLARMALAHGDRETALAAAVAAESDAAILAGRVKTEWYGRVVRAMVDGDPAPLVSGIDEFAKESFPIDAATVAEEAAVALAQYGDLEQARAVFTRAADQYDDLGATNDLRRLQNRLRAYGIRRGPRAQHRRARVGWEALTEAERSIVDLVAEGLPNAEIASRLFISRRTVETHVSRALRKLQLSSRVDLLLASRHRGEAGASG